MSLTVFMLLLIFSHTSAPQECTWV